MPVLAWGFGRRDTRCSPLLRLHVRGSQPTRPPLRTVVIMAIAEKIEKYVVSVMQTNYLGWDRTLRLSLESGGTAYLGFPPVRPPNWWSFDQGAYTILLPVEQYDDIYHVLQTENPVFFTALDLLGLQIAAVHTELDLSLGEPTGEGFDDQSLEALVVRARRAAG